nr:VWA domain-containing protein [uncultured Rhodopila sp.]
MIAVGGPLVVIGGLWAWTGSTNAPPDPGPLFCDPEQTLSWVDSPNLLTTTYAPVAVPDARPLAVPPPIDLLIMVDVSGSTDSTRDDMVQAGLAVMRQLKSRPGSNVALISFEVGAVLQADWTDDVSVMANALRRLHDLGGENDSRAGFDLAAETLRHARKDSRKIIVFYTDGELVDCSGPTCPAVRFTWNDMAAAGGALRRMGADIYAVGTPGHLNPNMAQITGSNDHQLRPDNQSEIMAKFREAVASGTGQALTPARPPGIFSEGVDGRLFDAAVPNTGWLLSSGYLTREVDGVPGNRMSFEHGLVPKVVGLMPLQLAPPKLTYLDRDGRAVEQNCRVRNTLVISPLFLLWSLLPCLGWSLRCLLVRPPDEIKPPTPRIPDPLPPPAGDVLRFPPPAERREPVVPTLFIGLGRWGGGALQAARLEMLHAHAGEAALPPCSFLAIDVDGAKLPTTAADFALPYQSLVAPAAVTDVYSYLDDVAREHRTVGGNAQMANYRHASRQELNLGSGSHGDRLLAHTALLRWFDKGGLAADLGRHLDELLRRPALGGVRQIVLFAHAAGGFGSAALLDVARILRRRAREVQQHGDLIPEIIAIVCSDTDDLEARKRRDALFQEDSTSRSFGLYPQHIVLGQGDPLLDRTDSEAPLDTLLAAVGTDAETQLEAAMTAAVLVDANPRLELLSAIAQTAGPTASIQASAIAVRRAHVRDLVAEELLVRVIAARLLGGVQLAPDDTGFAIAPATEEDARNALQKSVETDAAASPWRPLVEASSDASRMPAFLAALASVGEDNLEWMIRAAAHSLSNAFAEPGRNLTPEQVAAGMTLLAKHLRGSLRTEAQILAAPANTLTMMDALADRLDLLASALRRWTGALLAAMAEAAKKRSALLRDIEPSNARLALLDTAADEAMIDRWLADAVRAWAGQHGPDADPIGERVGFAVTIDNNALLPVVRSRIGHRTELRTPDAALRALRDMAEAIASLVPASHIDTAIARLDPLDVRRLARGLTQGHASKDALLVHPGAGEESAAGHLRSFLTEIAGPVDQRAHREATGGDRSAIRWIGWAPLPAATSPAPLPVVQPADVAGERLRQNIVHLLQRTVETMPRELSIAFAKPDRFRAFATAYTAGHLELRADAAGRMSWWLKDARRFITQGDRLANAAAAFAADDRAVTATYPPLQQGGGFSLFNEVRAGSRTVDRRAEADLVVLAAIKLALEDV